VSESKRGVALRGCGGGAYGDGCGTHGPDGGACRSYDGTAFLAREGPLYLYEAGIAEHCIFSPPRGMALHFSRRGGWRGMAGDGRQ
jgi:hypothetical protein